LRKGENFITSKREKEEGGPGEKPALRGETERRKRGRTLAKGRDFKRGRAQKCP